MDIKKLALLIGALVTAVFSAFLARGLFAEGGSPQATAQIAKEQQGMDVLVATRTLPVGTIIDASAFRYQPWPKDMVDEGHIRKGGESPQSLAGTVVRYAIPAGQPVTRSALVKPGDRGFLAAALGPGMRAVTVPISATTGVAGFIFPGDRVDLVLTQEVAGGGDGQPLKTSETIIRNLRVLAVDQTMDKTPKEGETVDVKPASTATLEVTPKMAEKIAVAQNIGSLALTLRSLADNTADLEAAIAAGEVSVPASGDAKAEKQMMLAVAAMPNDRATTFTTGGEVSRFQRTSVPARAANAGVTPEEEEARRLQAQLQVRQLRAKASPAVVIRRAGAVSDN